MNRITRSAVFGLCLLAACAPLGACAHGGGGNGNENGGNTPEPPVEKVADLDKYDLEKYLEPIFAGSHVYNETAFLLMDEEGHLPDVQLYYPITEIVSVRSYDLQMKYVSGRDYRLKEGKIEIPEGSQIYNAACPYDYYYSDTYVSGNEWWPEADGSGAQMQTEAQNGAPGLTGWQIAVTYRHEGTWQNAPADKRDKLPKTNAKLLNGEPLKVAVLGDSISVGWAASGYEYTNLGPHMPQYFNLVTDYLKTVDPEVTAVNLSMSGQTSQWGAAGAQIKSVTDQKPDLLLIAFGMNDGADRGVTAPIFKNNINRIITQVRALCPDTEFVLVSPMLPNEEVGFTQGTSILQHHTEYADVLLSLEGEGIAVADVTALHSELLTRKAFRDMSSNNINHPNDFVHRLYAQAILRTLIGK